MHEQLADLREGRPALHEARQRRAVVGVGDRAQREVHGARVGGRRRRRHGRAQRRLEGRLQAGAPAQEARVPLPALVDAVEPAVVQLVAEVQRELEVVVGQRVVGERVQRRELGGRPGRGVAQQVQEPVGERTTR